MTGFKCRNGDTLDALHAEKRKIELEIEDLRKRERVILDQLAPIAAAISGASSRKLNIECRLNIWRAEFDASRSGAEDNGDYIAPDLSMDEKLKQQRKD